MFSNSDDQRKLLFGSLFGIAGSFGLSIVLLPIAALGVLCLADPSPFILPAGIAVLYISCIFGGFLGAKIGERFLCSLISGLGLFALILAISFFIPGKSYLGVLGCVLCFIGIPLFFALGGSISAISASRRPKRNRNRKRR